MLAQEPAGQLYWITEEYPNHYFDHNQTKAYEGAEDAINYACTQYSGVGTYNNTIRMYYDSEDADKAGHCENKHHLIPDQVVLGEDYTAYLYCNGVKRLLNDLSPCEAPAQIVDDNNLGTECEE